MLNLGNLFAVNILNRKTGSGRIAHKKCSTVENLSNFLESGSFLSNGFRFSNDAVSGVCHKLFHVEHLHSAIRHVEACSTWNN